MAGGLSLVAGGGSRAAEIHPLPSGLGERWRVPAPPSPTLSELFAAHPRDGGWAGFLLAQADRGKPLLWVQDRMAILESGRIYPPGLGQASNSSTSRRAMRRARCGRWRRA